jgi:enamine deaminase RidA (YjgF/YER057c/UK114 family)
MRRVVRLREAPEVGQLVEIGGLLFSSTITGADPETGRLSPEPTRQAQMAFYNLKNLLDAAEVSSDELGLVRMAVPSGDLRGALTSQWVAMFPTDDRPARKVDVYPLPEGQLVQLQVIGVRGETRRQLVGQGGNRPDFEPAGVRLGDLVFSSAISGIDPGSGRLVDESHAQVRQAFRNMEAMVRQAGGTMDDVAHVLIFVRDRADNDDVLAAFLEAFPQDGATDPLEKTSLTTSCRVVLPWRSSR